MRRLVRRIANGKAPNQLSSTLNAQAVGANTSIHAYRPGEAAARVGIFGVEPGHDAGLIGYHAHFAEAGGRDT